MSTKKRGANVISLHDEEVEKTLWEYAVDNGMFIPTTIDGVERMEEILKAESLDAVVELPDVDMILSRKGASHIDNVSDSSSAENDLYAIAARKGQTISKDAREKMSRLKKSNKKKI